MSQEPNFVLVRQDGPASKPDADTARLLALRPGTLEFSSSGCGHEVWLYDDSLLDRIRDSGAMDEIGGGDTPFGRLLRSGEMVAISLEDDYGVHMTLTVGEPYSEEELAFAPWLEPQQAYLRLPGGHLRVESNEGCHVLPDARPDEAGFGDGQALIKLPPGDYTLTLYRIDFEALRREDRSWQGVCEALVLTPGGTPAAAVDDLLPFRPRRDMNWIGKYTIEGRSAKGLIWFDFFVDGYMLNLDRSAWKKLGLTTGSLLRITLTEPRLTLEAVIASSSSHASQLVDEKQFKGRKRAYASLRTASIWDNGEQVELIYCIRYRGELVDEKLTSLWLPMQLEVVPVGPAPDQPAQLIHDAGRRQWRHGRLRDKDYFDGPSETLAYSVGCLLAQVDEDFLELPEAVELIDEGMLDLGLRPLGDTVCEPARLSEREVSWRLYGGSGPILGAIRCYEDSFECFFFTAYSDGRWIVTGSGEFGKGKGIDYAGSFDTLQELFAQQQSRLIASARPRLTPANLTTAVQYLETLLSLQD